MKKWFALFVIVVFAGFSVLGAEAADEWGTVTIPAGKPVKIALGAMLTGDYASLGIDIRNGAEMAIQEKGYVPQLQAEIRGRQGDVEYEIYTLRRGS